MEDNMMEMTIMELVVGGGNAAAWLWRRCAQPEKVILRRQIS